ncbi:MAG: hypothetical protein Q8L06_02065, partial [Pseudohongiella sp.]|nr:hypothetical protein [Pseudohongiella sp.]
LSTPESVPANSATPFTDDFVLANLATPLFIDELERRMESASAEEKGEILRGIRSYFESLDTLASPLVSQITSLLVREVAYRDFSGWTPAYADSGEGIISGYFLYEVPLTEAGKSALEDRLRSRQDSYIRNIDILLSGIHNIEGADALIDARYNDFDFEAEIQSAIATSTSTSSRGLLAKWDRNGSLSATVIKARQGDEEALTRILRVLDHIDLPKTTLHRELLDLALIRRDEFATFLVPYVFSDDWAIPLTIGVKAACSPARTLIRMYSAYPYYNFYLDALEIDPYNAVEFSVIKAREWVMNNVPRDVLEAAGVVSR